MVKFGELGVHKVSLLSLESTRKKKIHISKCPGNDDASYKFMSRNLFFFNFPFGLMPHLTNFSAQRASL